MATYKVRKGDNYQKIAEQYKVPTPQLVRTNQSVPLSAGQVIKIPNNYGPRANAGSRGFQTPAQGSFVSGSGGVNTAQNPNIININTYKPGVVPAYRPFLNPLTPDMNKSVMNTLYPNNPAGGVIENRPIAPNAGSKAFQTPSTGTGSGFSVGANPLAAPVLSTPTGVYTGGDSANDQAWRNLWNEQAKNPPPKNNDFPGFWGGGKNGGFYKSLREARIATRKHKQAQGYEAPRTAITVAPPSPILGERTDLVNWNIG